MKPTQRLCTELQVRLNPEDKAILREIAQREGLSLSAYARTLLLADKNQHAKLNAILDILKTQKEEND